MKFLQQLNRQSALMRRRGHGDRGQKETGGEASTAMRCVSEACCFYFPVSEVCNILLNDIKARHSADTLRNTHFEQGMLLKPHLISPFLMSGR